jgi:hypothetical protein
MLYQLSYFRLFCSTKTLTPPKTLAQGAWIRETKCGQGWVRTTVGVSRQIYSLLRLTTPALALFNFSRAFAGQNRADGGIRTRDPEITNHVLWPTELHRLYFKPFSRKGLQR